MKFRAGLVVFGVLFAAGAGAQAPRDVPQGNWARSAVIAVTARGVMRAPGGRFDGARRATRTELAIALANLARSLEQGRWPRTGARPLQPAPKNSAWAERPINRYELAAILDWTARYAAQGLPKRAGQTFGKSEALPPPVALKGISHSHPAYAALAYLARNRMVWPGSVLLQPGPQPVTGAQTADAVAQMLAGLNDRLTDEPQNREDLGAPPHRHP